MVNSPNIASVNVVYQKDGKQTTRTIKFDGNFKFNIDDGNKKKTQNYEGEYIIFNGQIYKGDEIITELELPTVLAQQLIGMSNAQIIDNNGNKKDDKFTKGDFEAIELFSEDKPYHTGRASSWNPSDGINNRLRIMCGSGDNNKLNITGYYNTSNGGYKTESPSGSISIWMQE